MTRTATSDARLGDGSTVVVIGGGPAGSSCAIKLFRRRTRLSGPRSLPRADERAVRGLPPRRVSTVNTMVDWNDGEPIDYFRAHGLDRGEYVNLVRSLDEEAAEGG